MERFVGIIGIALILGICYLMSNNRKKISLKTVLSGLFLQFFLAVFILKVPLGQKIIGAVAKCIEKILYFANAGGDFVFGFLNNSPDKIDALFYSGANFLFATKLIITIIFALFRECFPPCSSAVADSRPRLLSCPCGAVLTF